MIAEGGCSRSAPPDELVAAPGDAFVASFTGGNLLHGFARPTREGLTEVVLDGGAVVFSTDRGEGRVGVVVYPWEVSIAHTAAADSALNHVSAPISSLVTIGNRVRVRVGPLVGEVTSASAERLGLERGQIVVASFKATGARLVPLARLAQIAPRRATASASSCEWQPSSSRIARMWLRTVGSAISSRWRSPSPRALVDQREHLELALVSAGCERGSARSARRRPVPEQVDVAGRRRSDGDRRDPDACVPAPS